MCSRAYGRWLAGTTIGASYACIYGDPFGAATDVSSRRLGGVNGGRVGSSPAPPSFWAILCRMHKSSWSERLVRELRKHTPAELLTRKSYRDRGFFDLLLPWLDAAIFQDPQAAIPWAKAAAGLVGLIEPATDDGEGIGHRSRRVQAWAMLGSAYRSAGDLVSADSAYGQALEIRSSGAVSELVSADTDRRLSTLRACQGRREDALALVEPAVTVLRRLAAPALPNALVNYGYVLHSLGRLDESLAALLEALATASPATTAGNKRVISTASKNVAILLVRANRLGGALSYLDQAEATLPHKRCAEARLIQWAKGAVYERVGAHARAEKLYRRSLAGFERLRLPWEAALVGIDLAALHHLTGEPSRMEAAALRAFDIFRNLSGTSARALQALSMWRDAVHQRTWDGTLPAVRAEILARVAGGAGCCKSASK